MEGCLNWVAQSIIHNFILYSRKLTPNEIGTKEINAKEINTVDKRCLYFLNKINVVTIKRFENV